jgi:cytochrome c-type biogenesis protein CcmH
MSITSKSDVRRALQCGVLFLAVITLAGAGDPASRFNNIGHQLMCICGCGQILLECNHVGCPDSDGMRNELMAAVNRGDSDSLVEQSFVQKYGPTVLAAPTTQGFDRTAWIMPIVVFIAGFGIVITVVRGWRNGPPPPPTGGSGPSGSTGGGPKTSRGDLEKFREQARRETDL